MRIRPQQIIVGIGTILLMTFLFIKSNVTESDSHNRFSQDLRHLKEVDATLNKNILQSRYGLLTNDYLLIIEIGEQDELQAALKNVPLFLEVDEQNKVNQLLDEFRDLQDQKVKLIERFKSRNSTVNDSLRYFPVATSNYIKNVPAAGPEQKDLEQVNFLLRDILTYYLLTETDLKPAISTRLELLQKRQNETSVVGKPDLDIIISHARIILKLKPELDEIVGQIVSLPTANKIEDVIELYDSNYDVSMHQADRYRLFLYILSVLLMAYVAFIIVKLTKARSTLNTVNESLEVRVLERTVELQSRERHFRSLIENSSDAIMLFAADGSILYASPSTPQVLGYSTDEMVTFTAFDLVPAEDHETMSGQLELVASQPGFSADLLGRGRHKDGSLRWLEGTFTNLLDDPNVAAIVNNYRDVTDRKRADAEREVISEILQGVTSTANLTELLHLIHRSIGKALSAENCFVALYDATTELLHMQFWVDKFDPLPPPFKMGRGFTGYVYRQQRAMLMTSEVIERLLNNGEIELQGTAPAIWLGVPLRTPSGIIGVMAVQHYEDKSAYGQRDLELLAAAGDQIALAIERKRVEEALRISEAQHRLLFQSNPQPAFVYDLETLAFLAVNEAAIRHYGYSREEFFTNITVKDIRPVEDIPEFLEKVSKVTPGGDSILAPSTHQKKNGIVSDVEITSHAMIFGGRPAEIVLVNDVTERKLADEKLKSFNKKLQQSNRELQDFAYVASHDLQEPLRKVQAFSDRLKTKYADKLEGPGLDYLERMRSAANRMQLLIQDLLTFSRVSTKAQPFVPVNLETIATEVLSDLEVKIEETGATVEFLDLPTIDADPLQMRQLLQNLIGNALKFQNGNTTPLISIRAQSIEANGSGPQCQISVKDNGIGFDEKYIDKIFAVFQRLHGRTEYEGSGVGLSICRKIAERHNGTITAQSLPDDGATFIVTLPINQAAVEIN